MDGNKKRSNNRLNHLDSLRGIAALIVVLSHFASMIPDNVYALSHHNVREALTSFSNAGVYTLIKLHMAGRSAVILFFVLSGFVLARSLENGQPSFLEYAVRRFFRIYPILFLTIIISYFLHVVIGYDNESQSNWLTDTCNPDMSYSSLLRNLVLWGTSGSNGFDGVIWSLVYELRISMLFPFILSGIMRFKLKAVIFWMLLSIIATMYLHHLTGSFATGFGEKNFALTLLDTVYFTVFFAAGAYLSVNGRRMFALLTKVPVWILVPLSMIVAYSFLKSDAVGTVLAGDYIRGTGAVGLIAFAMSFNKFENALNFKTPIWMGKISYSLYLVHTLIIYVVYELWPKLPLPLTIAAVLMTSLMAAHVMARLVEFPMNDWGKALSKRLRTAFAV